MKRYQVAVVVALGGAMVTATLIVGLGMDGHKQSRDAAPKHNVSTLQPGGSAGAGVQGHPSASSAPSTAAYGRGRQAHASGRRTTTGRTTGVGR